ncbi:MAG TPA: hypothetical protein VMV69_25835 [Pirellulales bacterium]|nr:hypothetical protein [Pirellulales bacterium]
MYRPSRTHSTYWLWTIALVWGVVANVPMAAPANERSPAATVWRPVIETCRRAQPCTVPQPVTTFETRPVAQGQWVMRQIREPGRAATRLKWVSAGWNVDPKTGVQYWRPGMLRPVRVERPGRVRTFRVWQPNIVTTPVPNP